MQASELHRLADESRVAPTPYTRHPVDVGPGQPLRGWNAKRSPFLDAASPLSTSSLETVRRIAESVIIAVISSTGLYLVGSVYIDAYYSRPRSA